MIALFQLMRQECDVIQHAGKALIRLRQPIEFRDQFGADRDARVSLAQELEDACHPSHVFRHDRRHQAMSLTRRPVAAIPIAPKRQERGQSGIGQLSGIFLAGDQCGQVKQDLVSFLSRVDTDIAAEIFLP